AGLGLCSSGIGLTVAGAAQLRDAGVQRVLIPVHCARQDAHDWLGGQARALETAHRALRACIEAHLPGTAEDVLTRPTMAHLGEAIGCLARRGGRTVGVRGLMAQDTEGVGFVRLSRRLGLLEPWLEGAAGQALERRVRLWLRDLPLCAAPRLRPLFAPAD